MGAELVRALDKVRWMIHALFGGHITLRKHYGLASVYTNAAV